MPPLNHWLHYVGLLGTEDDMDLRNNGNKTMALVSLADTNWALEGICINMLDAVCSQRNIADQQHYRDCETTMTQGDERQHRVILNHL